VSDRDDIDILDVLDTDRASVTDSIPQVEPKTGTIIFMDSEEEPGTKCRLLICGGDAKKRAMALSKLMPKKKVEPLGGKRDRPPEDAKKFVVSDDEVERRKRRALRFS